VLSYRNLEKKFIHGVAQIVPFVFSSNKGGWGCSKIWSKICRIGVCGAEEKSPHGRRRIITGAIRG